MITQVGNWIALSPKQAASYYDRQVLGDSQFERLLDHYSGEGFEFIPDRVMVIVGLAPQASHDTEAVPEPFVTVVAPSFRGFESSAPSHQAVSIVFTRERQTNRVAAAEVVINHSPYQIDSYTSVLTGEDGRLLKQTVERSQLLGHSPRRLASVLPALPKGLVRPGLSAPNLADMLEVAALIFRTLVSDDYARPLYPPEGLAQLLNESVIMQKWGEVEYRRFTQAYDAPGLSGGCCCCILCTCCNGCSTSAGCA